jgi:hypothetical protein
MKAVNDPTRTTLERFLKKAKELPWDAHPYAMALESRNTAGQHEWNEEHRSGAIGGIAVWATMIIGRSTVLTLNEILALMNIAAETGVEEHKKAADDMAASMHFLETVLSSFMKAIDIEHVAEQLFEDGLRTETERAAEFAAAEAAKAKVAKKSDATPAPQPKQPLSGTVHRRWEPSQN